MADAASGKQPGGEILPACVTRRDRRVLGRGSVGVVLGFACSPAETTDERNAASAPALAPADDAPSRGPATPSSVTAATTTLHVVARRPGPLGIVVNEGMEVAFAGPELIALHASAPLVRDPELLIGLFALIEGVPDSPSISVEDLGGRWPTDGFLVARASLSSLPLTLTRTLRWNGGTWERDDVLRRGVVYFQRPLGPYARGTTLMLPDVEPAPFEPRTARVDRARPTRLVRRLPDGTSLDGPALPPEPDSRYATARDGSIHAGSRALSTWLPGATRWHTVELPDTAEPSIAGFSVAAPHDVFVFGSQGASQRGPWLAHYDGRAWEGVVGPPCGQLGIERFVHRPGAWWAVCEPAQTPGGIVPSGAVLWRAGPDGRWERLELVAEGTTIRLAVRQLDPAQTSPALAPRPEAIALARDGTLWLVAELPDEPRPNDESPYEPSTWLLARSGAPAFVLELPSEDELLASLPR
jgi:hypothetical protein